MATPYLAPVRQRHLIGEHNHWCQQRKGKLIVCKYTGKRIKPVGA